jgi:hypothetical protein
VQLLRQRRIRRHAPEDELRRHRLRQGQRHIRPRPEDPFRILVRVEVLDLRHLGPQRVQCELERRHHPEAATAAAGCPEQVPMLLTAGGADHPVRGDNLDRTQVVAGQTVPSHDQSHAATECETCDAGARHLPAGGDETEQLGLAVHLPPGHPALRPRGPRGGVDVHRLHRRQVDHQSVVAYGTAGYLVAPAADAHHRPVLAGHPHRLHHIGGAGAAGDHCRIPVVDPVPHLPGGVVRRMGPVDDLPA